ncbi:MAG: transferase hexapeptide repeat containing protein [Phycisphaerales bacterium]|nr:transferase hexapeptide repeat containing protein [Phycisphaerales bacterium]
MAIQVTTSGERNELSVPQTVLDGGWGSIILEGSDNRIEIAEPAEVGHLHIELSGGSSLRIGPGCILRNLFVYACDRGSVRIGGQTGFNGLVRLLLHEQGAIEIGSGCLFGGDTDLTISDMHSILDAATGERLNRARSICVADRVWVGQKATLLKGVSIGGESVIAAGAVVTGAVPSGCIAAGNPARVVREGVTWRHELI